MKAQVGTLKKGPFEKIIDPVVRILRSSIVPESMQKSVDQ